MFAATRAPRYAAFGQGTGTIFLAYLRCTGNESRLIDCFHNGIGNFYCNHYEDAGVVCARECSYMVYVDLIMDRLKLIIKSMI